MIILPLPNGSRLVRRFHISESARRRYEVHEEIVDLRGRVVVAEPVVAERLAASINEARNVRRFPESGVSGAEIFAAALLDEAVHLLLDVYRRERYPAWLSDLEERLEGRMGRGRLEAARRTFVQAFPASDVFAGRTTPDAWLAGRSEDLPNGQIALEERLAVRLANENPALSRLHELVDEAPLGDDDRDLISLMEARLAELPGLPAAAAEDETDLWSLLRAPLLASPTSLEGQLTYIRRHWSVALGPAMGGLLDRLVASLDLLAERRFAGPPGPPGPAPILDRRALRGSRDEPRAFSHDADWMPRVVMVAKNAYVWLDQLSKRSGRAIERLDQIPDEALSELGSQGFSALWLIGLWQRSQASARIKRLRGQEDAVASAYALDDYRIADDLGGEEGWRELRDRAARHGLRLASDMVPNHVGIDGRWVAEHPERFIGLDAPPYPGYSFTGPDLSGDERMQVRIEDGYWESRDAAVVFERIDAASGKRRYLYHGNDGTTMPWNDTAQLDYLSPEVREAVIQVILDVARRFPIIRFDAAMTLAKQHVQRLWYPPPGHGGAIPSRSTYGSMSDEAFDERMPQEFWREVVDRVAAEAPGTLLLAEAFWMMEGYFVRTLGMHRVYNSAFMNMMAREANAEYGQLMRNVLEFEPQILGRFVNFMNNPDEETAIEQFGDGDKAFGVATLMATLPGLPMFGHGQVEGLREKYGMEYRRAKLDESPNPHLVARHAREIAPLLARRAEFAGSPRFRLFEVEGEHGPLHDVHAYANGGDTGPIHLVLFHNRFGEAHGRIRGTVPFTPPEGGGPRREGLAEALSLTGGHGLFVRYREHRSGLEHLLPSEEWLRDGLEVRLGAYGCRVLLDLHEVHDADGSWRRLYEHLGGRGVPDLGDAFREMELQPLHEAFAAFLRAGGPTAAGSVPAEAATIEAGAAEGSDEPSAGVDDAPLRAFAHVLARTAPDASFDPATAARRLRRAASLHAEGGGEPHRTWLRAWALASGFERPAREAADLRLEAVLARVLPPEESDGSDAASWTALWRALLPAEPGADEAAVEGIDLDVARSSADGLAGEDEPRAGSRAGASEPRERAEDGVGTMIAVQLRRLAEDGELPRILNVHEHDGIRWFRREPFRAFTAAWVARLGLLGGSLRERAEAATRWAELESASRYRFDDLLAFGEGLEERDHESAAIVDRRRRGGRQETPPAAGSAADADGRGPGEGRRAGAGSEPRDARDEDD